MPHYAREPIGSMDPLSPAMRIEDYGVRDLLDSPARFLAALNRRLRETLRLEGRLKLGCLERQLLSATGGLRLPDDLTLIRVQWTLGPCGRR